MNSIIWLVYFADKVDMLSNLLKFGIIIMLISIGLSAIGLLLGDETTPNARKFLYKILKRCSYVLIAFTCVLLIIPSERTLYVIAGVNMTEIITSNPDNKQTLDDIRKIISNAARSE